MSEWYLLKLYVTAVLVKEQAALKHLYIVYCPLGPDIGIPD